jgi:hypothetical protein
MTQTTGQVSIELPRYKCHKEVWAHKIEEIKQSPANEVFLGGSYQIVPADKMYAPITVPASFVEKHKPEVGGYYVIYQDGYTSYSPAKAFEEGYTPVFNPAIQSSVGREMDAGCFARAQARGEQTFTLVAQDRSTPRTICFWIMENIETTPDEKLLDALKDALAMRVHPNRKAAD